MPKTPVDFSNTIIYKIVCKDINIKNCYVGHTTNFVKRKCCHKSLCNNENDKWYNLYVYKFIRENGNWDNWEMIMVEQFACSNLLEATKRERYWIEQLNADLNRVIPTRTKEEYYEQNKEIIFEKQKEYKEQNKETISKINKKYYEANKDKIREKNKTKIECECGGCYTYPSKSRHFKSKKHQEYLLNKEEN